MINHATDFDFENQVLRSPGLVLVDFWAPWCGPCQRLGPVLEGLGRRFGDGLKIVKVNVESHQGWANRLGVSGIPALLFFRDGKLIDRQVGFIPEGPLAAHIQSLQKVA